MNKTALNRMQRRLQEIKNSANAEHTTPELQGHLDMLKQQIEAMNATMLALRGEDSSSTRLTEWFNNFLATQEAMQGALILKANESKFKITVLGEKAFGFNLKYLQNPWRPECPEDITAFRNLHRETIMRGDNPWIPAEAFNPFITMLRADNYTTNLVLEFKYSKRLFRDEEEMNQILTSFINQLWDCCRRNSKKT